MNYVLGKRIFNILNHVIFPAKTQISKPIDVSVFMFDIRMINMSSECEYDWYWKISASLTEYEVCDSFASFTRQQTSYSGSTCWYFRYQSIHIQIAYTYRTGLVRFGCDLNLTRGCHRFYYLAPFTVFDSFSHPFLPCQCLFPFCVVWRINLRTASQDQNAM